MEKTERLPAALKQPPGGSGQQCLTQQLLLTQTGEDSPYTLDIHYWKSSAPPKHILIIITVPGKSTTNILWVDPNPQFGHRGPAQFALPAELSGRSLLLNVFGLHPNLQQQSYDLCCYGQTQLSGPETLYKVHLEGTKMDVPHSLLDITSKKTFPLLINKDQSQVSALPQAAQTSDASCLVICKKKMCCQQSLAHRISADGCLNNFHMSLPSRCVVQVKVLVLHSLCGSHNLSAFSVVSASNVKSIRTYLSRQDLAELKVKALKHRGKERVKHAPLSHFFRNRWNSYFVGILANGGFMETYDKDNNGDNHSPINGNIKGLFFSPALEFHSVKPPYFSLFGEWRLHVPAHVLFHKASNLYFADFYCHNETHYVTLVITSIGSEEDSFCSKRLLKMDPYNNEFLFKTRCKTVTEAEKVMTTLCLKTIVEVLYTESLDIVALMTSYGQDEVYFTHCQTMGAGQSKPTGIPKKAGCATCNLPESF